MSILIYGMDMPTSCYKCDMRRRDGMDIVCPIAHERFSVADVNILEYRLKNCPLLPVPEHGRLGDLDALVDWLKLSYGTSIPIVRGLLFSSIIKEIQEYPSVIPAEQKSKEEGEAK